MFDKKDWQAALVQCGINKGDNLIISGTLLNDDLTIDGWPTILDACIGMVGIEGTIMTIVQNQRSEPLHHDHTLSKDQREKLIKAWSQSSYPLITASPLENAFFFHDEVRSIVHPGYRFYAIGKYAPFMVRKVSKHFPLHDDGPLQAALKLKAKCLHFGDDEPWLIEAFHASAIQVNQGVHHIDGIARWEHFLDKESIEVVIPYQSWTLNEEKVRRYEFNQHPSH